MFKFRLLFGLACVLVPNTGYCQWGDLTAKFVIDGKAPEPRLLPATKDQEVCGKTCPDDSLIINSANGGIANVVLSIYLKTGDAQPKVHPDYAKVFEQPVELDNRKCQFVPHIAVLRTGQSLVLKNSDAVAHNTNIATLDNQPINPILPANAQVSAPKLTKEERLPANVSCSIHPWMTAKLIIKTHPYVGVSDGDGNVVIRNVPAGKWTFQVWQEKAGYVQDVLQDGKVTKWSKGRFELTIKAGENNLGEIKVPSSSFTKN